MTYKKEKFALLLFLISLWVPLLFWKMDFIKEKPLYGAYVSRNKPVFSDSLWFSSVYQQQAEGYINDSVCLRNFFIRFRNQLDFSLFNKTHAIDNFFGRQGYLMAESHLDFYYGKSGNWIDSTQDLASKIKKLQDTLASSGKTLLIAIAPNKGFTYPEYAPFWYNPSRSGNKNDYVRLIEECKIKKAKTIDFQNWFYQLKNRGVDSLYPKNGVHWTQFLATRALDSLVRYLEKERREKLPRFIYSAAETVDTARYSDNDMERLLNLFSSANEGKYRYQNFRVDTTSSKKINIAFISDSYGFSWFFENQVQQVFNKWTNWYYYKRVDSNQSSHGKNTSMVALHEQIANHDVFVVLATGTNLSEIGWGFIQRLYDLYFNPRAKRINEWMDKIRADNAFMQQIISKAKSSNVDIEAQIYFDACYQVDEEDKQRK